MSRVSGGFGRTLLALVVSTLTITREGKGTTKGLDWLIGGGGGGGGGGDGDGGDGGGDTVADDASAINVDKGR